MKTRTIRWIASAVILFTSLGQTLAVTRTWDGGPAGTGTSWNEAVNWTSDIAPGLEDNALFDTAGLSANKVISLDAPQSIEQFTIPSWRGLTIFIGNSDDVTAGNTLTLKRVLRGSNSSNMQTFSASIVLAADSIWDINSGYNSGIAVNGVISGAGRGVAKWGQANDGGTGPGGTLTLRGANTYTGDTAINMGTLTLDFNTAFGPTANIVTNSSLLRMNGGSLNLAAKSSASRSQTFDDLAIGLGPSSMSLASASGANLRLSLGEITRETGGTLILGQPTGNTSINANNGYTTVATNDATGILGAYLTVAGADWAMNNGVNIVAYNNYVTLSGEAAIIANIVTNNVQVNNTTTGTVTLASSNVTINTLKASGTTARLLDLGGGTLRLGAVGGILTPSSTGALTLTNGTLTAGGADNTAGEIVFVNATAVNNNAVIADNGTGAVALTKAGVGTLTLAAPSTHTGGTYVNAGTLLLTSGTNRLAATGDIVVNGGTLNLGGSTQNASGTVAFRGGTTSNGTIIKSGTGYDAQAGTVSAKLEGAVGLVKTTPSLIKFTGANTYSGDTTVLEGTASFEVNSIVKGAVFVGSPSGGYPASLNCVNTPLNKDKNWTVYQNGSLNLGSSAQYVQSKITIIGGSVSGNQPYFQNGSSVEMTGGTLSVNAYTSGFPITTLACDKPAVFSGTLRFSHTLTIADGSAFHDMIFSGNHTGTGLTKNGAGTLVMTGSGKSYTGTTAVNAGTLLVNTSSGSGTGNSAVSVAKSATLGGTGSIGGVSGYTAANVSAAGIAGSEATLAPGTVDATTGDHVLGTLTVGSGTQANNVTFGAYSTLKINFDTNGNCDKLVVNGTLSLNAATDKLVLNIADYDALKVGTYTLATFTSLATPGSTFDLVDKPTKGTLNYTATSLEYIVHGRGTTLIIR